MSLINKYNISVTLPAPTGYIYKITNTANNKIYIGQTKDYMKRITQHLEGDGSKPLLYELIMGNIENFKFEVLEIFYQNEDLDAIEDNYIQTFDCLHPIGYNMRMNQTIESNGDLINLNSIEIQAKFCFNKDGHKVFSVGEYTSARSYQILTNIKADTETENITKKKLFKFNYLELKTTSDQGFMEGQIYDLTVKYKFDEDLFLVTQASNL